jgi:hypothetical protein
MQTMATMTTTHSGTTTPRRARCQFAMICGSRDREGSTADTIDLAACRRIGTR